MAPAPGFEPGTKWLTATYSTAELCRNVNKSFTTFLNIYSFCKKANKKCFLLLFFVFVFTQAVSEPVKFCIGKKSRRIKFRRNTSKSRERIFRSDNLYPFSAKNDKFFQKPGSLETRDFEAAEREELQALLSPLPIEKVRQLLQELR